MISSSPEITSQLFFAERQKFTQWWLWVILLVQDAAILFTFSKVLQRGGDRGDEFIGLTIAGLVLIIVTGGFLVLRLDTQVRRDGVYARFFPFHRKFRKYTWDEMTDYRVRKYSPIGEYGGWGLRGFGKNRALNVSGNTGLQLHFHNGKKLLIGTQKPEELSKVLEHIQEFNREYRRA